MNKWQEIVRILNEKSMTIAVAESITGGAISAKIVENSGASKVFEYGFTVYSSLAKHRILNVNEVTLKQYGAVSKEVAKEMAEGLRLYGADIAIVTTGYAGPTIDEEYLTPLGRVYIAIACNKAINIYECNFVGDRLDIINQTIEKAYELLLNEIEKI